MPNIESKIPCQFQAKVAPTYSKCPTCGAKLEYKIANFWGRIYVPYMFCNTCRTVVDSEVLTYTYASKVTRSTCNSYEELVSRAIKEET